MWIHSPIAFNSELASEISCLGPVRYLIAPNIYHHLFLSDWLAHFPEAELVAAPGLSAKRADLQFGRSLDGISSELWLDEIDQVLFSGSRAFDEYIFFHRSSSTAILTDLIVNIRAEHQTPFGRIVAQLDGVTFPNGGTPLLYRWSMKDKAAGAAAIYKLLHWSPSQAVISHGEWFRENATEELRQRFDWLPLKPV